MSDHFLILNRNVFLILIIAWHLIVIITQPADYPYHKEGIFLKKMKNISYLFRPFLNKREIRAMNTIEMDKISFGLEKSEYGGHLTTSIFINGIDLRSLLRTTEYEQLRKCEDYSTRMAAAYEGISPFIAFELQDHFNTNTLSEYKHHEKYYTLFEYCITSAPGDYTLACKIEKNKTTVRWYDFKNFSRLVPIDLEYKVAFNFDRKKYEMAVEIGRTMTSAATMN
mgnify:CR=1 FL=1